MKVSFIIPIYKVEKYIDECIQSLVEQTFEDFEILLIDDGSPDDSPQICDSWAKRDRRIKVCHKPNGGLSDARNAGIALAKGDYLVFVDGDDFWTDKMHLEKLVDVVNSYPECDFINFNCSYYFSDNTSYRKWKPFDSELCKLIDKDSALQALVASGVVPMSACLKVIRRDVFRNDNMRFIKGIHCEDIPWFIDLLDRSCECIFINQYVYAYRQNVSGSISASFGEKSFNDLIYIIQMELDKLSQRNFSESAKNALLSFLAYEFCILLANIRSLPTEIQQESRARLMKYRWLLKYTLNPKVKLVSLVSKIVGISITERLLSIYMKNH